MRMTPDLTSTALGRNTWCPCHSCTEDLKRCHDCYMTGRGFHPCARVVAFYIGAPATGKSKREPLSVGPLNRGLGLDGELSQLRRVGAVRGSERYANYVAKDCTALQRWVAREIIQARDNGTNRCRSSDRT